MDSKIVRVVGLVAGAFVVGTLLVACSSIKERQDRASDLVGDITRTASGTYHGTKKTVVGVAGAVKATVDWVNGTVEEINERVEKLEQGIEKMKEAKQLIDEGLHGVDEEGEQTEDDD